MVYAGTRNGKDWGFYLDKDKLVGKYWELDNDAHMALMEGQCHGKRIVFHGEEKAPTLEEPLPPTTEQLAENARHKRDSLIKEIWWRVERYDSQKTLGIETSDDEATYKKILAYIQELRDVTKQEGFPNTVTYPTLEA